MKAIFTTKIDLGNKPDKGLLELAELPQVKSWNELSDHQKKEYARIYVYECSGDDIADKLYNADDGIIKLEE